jgi:hypothetical protein
MGRGGIEAPPEAVTASRQSGQQTAKAAAKILVAKQLGFVVPTAKEREAILIAFVRAGFVIYGRAFDVIKVGRPVNLENPDDVQRAIEHIVLYEIKSTNKANVLPDFRRYFFSLSTAELLVAQNLRERYKFVFVNTRTKDHLELSLQGVFQRARGIYPTWSIQF